MDKSKTAKTINILLFVFLLIGILLTVYSISQIRSLNSEAARSRVLYPNAIPYNGVCVREAGMFVLPTGTIEKNSSKTLKFSSCLSQTTLSMQLILDYGGKLGSVTIQIIKPDGNVYTGPSQGALFRPVVPDGEWTIVLTNLNTKQNVSYTYYMSAMQL